MADQLHLHFIKSGFSTSLQDLGRTGLEHIGIPKGGAMDRESMALANYLVGNQEDEPVLEITLIGPKIRFVGHGQIAFAGGDFIILLNDQPIPQFETIDVKNEDLLEIKSTKSGCRLYMATAGKCLEKQWLNSFSYPSAYIQHDGMKSKVEAGDLIRYETRDPIKHRSIAIHKRPIFTNCSFIRVFTGPDFDQFEIEQIKFFFEKTFTVSSESNRMGLRLKESIEPYQAKADEISSGVIPGTIQITGSGQPIILTQDAQTTGGYPRIANVTKVDLNLIGQLKPGDELKFMLISLNETP